MSGPLTASEREAFVALDQLEYEFRSSMPRAEFHRLDAERRLGEAFVAYVRKHRPDLVHQAAW